MVDTTQVVDGKYFKKYSNFLIFLVITFTIIGNSIIYLFKYFFPNSNEAMMEFLVVTVLTTNLCAVISVVLVQRHSERWYKANLGINAVLDSFGRMLLQNEDLFSFMSKNLSENREFMLILLKRFFSEVEECKTEEDFEKLMLKIRGELLHQFRKTMNVEMGKFRKGEPNEVN
tara:strand:- start:2551 stop:3069 length:519 start_codon:yes stop_codon:yes gene_type:complete